MSMAMSDKITSSAARSQREVYQQTVIMLLGVRRTKSTMGITEFLAGHATLIKQVRDRWATLGDKDGVPSPDLVFSWL